MSFVDIIKESFSEDEDIIWDGREDVSRKKKSEYYIKIERN
jgi:hypothetical protein